MSTITVFVQAHGQAGIKEAEIAADLAAEEIRAELARLGFEIGPETLVFIDDADEPVRHGEHGPVHGLKHGCRVHVTHCHRIKTTVHYLHRTIEREFAAGVRVRGVKSWAVHELKMGATDAAEHVLQLCNSTDRPAGDTPLHELTKDRHCEVCFDFVPEKRVEG
jgi:hypothetical protein